MNLKKRYQYLIILIVIFLSFLSLNKINPKYMFASDSLTKYIQGVSVLENNFQDDFVNCDFLDDYGGCNFLMEGFFEINNNLTGPFPIFQSYLTASILYFFEPEII